MNEEEKLAEMRKMWQACEKFCDEHSKDYSCIAICNCLWRGGLYSMDNFKNASDDQIKKLRGVGKKKAELIIRIRDSLI